MIDNLDLTVTLRLETQLMDQDGAISDFKIILLKMLATGFKNTKYVVQYISKQDLD